jgi:hypothetical protein
MKKKIHSFIHSNQPEKKNTPKKKHGSETETARYKNDCC